MKAKKQVGRKKSAPNLKKNQISLKLPQWLIEWLDEQPQSRAILIEDALKKKHKLKTPQGVFQLSLFK
ncbi:hypothetical protein KAR91_83095 [Candidatus Pacearchaeota archaeon]|nr:hypothetical protein [Candidatus Pacearchaeota archaeon]